jgi:hypothetical protein
LPLLALAVLASGCLFSPDEEAPVIDEGRYPLDLSAPDSLMQQLLTAYKRREIDPYATLLTKRFEFTFQEGDVGDLGDQLTFEQDSLFTRNMFESPDVVDVRLSMTWQPPTEELWENEPSLRIVLSDLLLDVEQSNNVTLRVSGQTQHYYFQLGRPEDGEDGTRYYIRAWRDIGGSAAGSGPRTLDTPVLYEENGKVVEEVTWGELRRRLITD